MARRGTKPAGCGACTQATEPFAGLASQVGSLAYIERNVGHVVALIWQNDGGRILLAAIGACTLAGKTGESGHAETPDRSPSKALVDPRSPYAP